MNNTYQGKSIYLAGSMTARKDRGTRWRRAITPYLKRVGFTDIYDPTIEESKYLDFLKENHCETFHELKIKNRSAYSMLMKLVEEHDLVLIGKSTHVLVYLDPPAFKSDGTVRELAEATGLKKEIFVVLKYPWFKVWGWTYRRCNEIDKLGKLFYNFKDLREYIKNTR